MQESITISKIDETTGHVTVTFKSDVYKTEKTDTIQGLPIFDINDLNNVLFTMYKNWLSGLKMLSPVVDETNDAKTIPDEVKNVIGVKQDVDSIEEAIFLAKPDAIAEVAALEEAENTEVKDEL